jgi:hypothetical protein
MVVITGIWSWVPTGLCKISMVESRLCVAVDCASLCNTIWPSLGVNKQRGTEHDVLTLLGLKGSSRSVTHRSANVINQNTSVRLGDYTGKAVASSQTESLISPNAIVTEAANRTTPMDSTVVPATT